MSTVQNGHQSLVLFTPGAAPDIQTQIANGSMQVRSNSGNASACTQYRLAPASVSLSMSSAMGRRRYTGNMEPVVTGLVSTPSSLTCAPTRRVTRTPLSPSSTLAIRFRTSPTPPATLKQQVSLRSLVSPILSMHMAVLLGPARLPAIWTWMSTRRN